MARRYSCGTVWTDHPIPSTTMQVQTPVYAESRKNRAACRYTRRTRACFDPKHNRFACRAEDCLWLAVNTATLRLGVMLGLSASVPVVCFLRFTQCHEKSCCVQVHEKDSCVLRREAQFFFFFFQVHERTRACKKHNLQFWHINSLFRRAVAARIHTSSTRFGVILGLSAPTRVSVAVSFIQFTFLALLSLV